MNESATPSPKQALIEIALFSLQELLRHAPEMFAKLTALFTKPAVTLEDIAALRDEIAGLRYRDIVTGTAIPPAEQT